MDLDSRAVALLCWMIGRSDDEPVRPLSPKEWSEIERRLSSSSLNGPGALIGMMAGDLAQKLDVEQNQAERLAALLGRVNQMDAELERLTDRGVSILTRIEPEYPAKLIASLKHTAPPMLFVAGEISLLQRGGVAVVGSRNIDESGRAFAEELGHKCASSRTVLISGGARGTDAIAMQSTIESGGSAVGVLADSLERAVRASDLRESLEEGKLVLTTPYSPAAGFTIGAAMGRNKIIYSLADYAVVVSSEEGKGGTWTGATEALKGKLCPVFVRMGDEIPDGNQALIEKGALGFPRQELKEVNNIEEWLRERAAASNRTLAKNSTGNEQASLF